MAEARVRFATTEHRERLFMGFEAGAAILFSAGCLGVYLDGSFVTAKEVPNDFDAAWNPVGVNANMLDPVLLDFSNKRENQKKRFFGEFFISTNENTPGATFLEFFQRERFSGRKKGIVLVTPSNAS